MADNIFENLTDEEQKNLWMYIIFNADKIKAKTEQWTKEAKKAGMTLTEYLESINPLDNKEGLPNSIKMVTNAKDAENYPISEDISKGIEEINKLIFENGQAESGGNMKNQYEIDYQQGYDSANDEWLERIDKIRAEIEPTRKMYLEMNDIDWLNGCDYVLSVIDKYKAESEE